MSSPRPSGGMIHGLPTTNRAHVRPDRTATPTTLEGYGGRFASGDAWERQRGSINNRYGTESAMNAYGRFISQQRGSRQLGDMSRQFGRQTPIFKSQFGQRGLAGPSVKSGVMQNSMQNYLGDYGRDYGRSQQETTQTLQGYDLNQDNLNSWRQQQMADIEASKATAIANDAAQLEWLRSIVGGL